MHRVLSFLLIAAPSALAQAVTNAPVAPDAVYVFRTGGLSVVDLNGFGCSTGNPEFDPTGATFEQGGSNWIHNPNLVFQGALLGLPLPTSSLNGGSAGVFTLTRNSDLSDLLADGSALVGVEDLMLGQPLDLTLNGGPAPFGCTQGAPNLCAASGLQAYDVGMAGPNTLGIVPLGSGEPVPPGTGNLISFAPNPNPPPLLATPQCTSPEILGAEPIPLGTGLANLLVPGDPFGLPELGVPPSGLLSPEQNAPFAGPGHGALSITECPTYAVRQQIGHFLYALDRRGREIVVLNSNRFTVLDRIAQADPRELAMSPDLDLLAVTNTAADRVDFIDIDPSSATLHSVVKSVQVGHRPSGIAWDPGGEDILVCNEGDDTVSVIAAFDLSVRKVLSGGLDRPFGVAITRRQDAFGYQSNVYYAYLLDRAGRVSLFESGPAGVGGWGFDDIVGQAPDAFENPRAIQVDPLSLTSAVWIAHAAAGDPSQGQVSRLVLESRTTGLVPLAAGEQPNLRGKSLRVADAVGPDQLSGLPSDLAFDNLRNLGGLRSELNPFGSLPAHNSKDQVRRLPGSGEIANTNEPLLLFVSVRAGGKRSGRAIDVIDLASLQRVDTNAFEPGVQSIEASGVLGVADYFRQ